MPVKNIFSPKLIFSFMAIFIFLLGCTHYVEQPIYDIDLEKNQNKFGFPIEVVYTDEFRNAQLVEKKMGDTFIIPLGENFVSQTNKLVQNVFSNIQISDDTYNSNVEANSKYLLIPDVSYIKQTSGALSISDAKFSIGIEWKLLKRSGQLVWVETVSGSGTNPNGSMFDFNKRQRERINMALEDLFTKSQRVIVSSSVLRRLD